MQHNIKTLSAATLVWTTLAACAVTPEIRHGAAEADASASLKTFHADPGPVALEAPSSVSVDPGVSNASSSFEDSFRLTQDFVSYSLFQEETPPAAGTSDKGVRAKSDKTGTNPINFQRDVRVYNEFSWLNTEGDGEQNVTTLEFRTPFAGGKWQFRARGRFSDLSADLDDDGSDDINETGFGDTDIRFLTVPYVKGLNAIAYAIEAFFDTASEDVLGRGTTSLGPQVFYARFFKPGTGIGPYKGGGLFAPGLQYQFSVDEDDGRADTDQFNIDLNLLMMGTSKQFWFFTNPQIVIDNEAEEQFGIFDLEFGWMMTNWFPEKKGHSFYIRPAFGVGSDRPTDFGIELGYKIVGW